MIRIINTPCSRVALAIDTAMTAIGWLGFCYLVANGVIAMLHGNPYQADFAGAPLSTGQVLLIYLTVAAFNALLLVLWAIVHKRQFENNRRHNTALLDDETLAAHFSLSRHQLHEIQDSRVITIHHAEDGEIDKLEMEMDYVATMPIGKRAFETARAA